MPEFRKKSDVEHLLQVFDARDSPVLLLNPITRLIAVT
jgi:hypothetical protein